jgi:CheY-like chemotaxis protein
MPVMDGYEATRQIRALTDRKDLPIIAMTAAVMPQDRHQSLDAGMNDHVGKPIDPNELATTLVHWIEPYQKKRKDKSFVREINEIKKNCNDKGAHDDMERLAQHLPGISLHQALARLGGNLTLYQRLLTSFVKVNRDTPETLRTLVEACDWESLYEKAHTLKGEAGNLGIDNIMEQADLLGSDFKEGKMESLPMLAEQLAILCEETLETLDNRLNLKASDVKPGQ